MLKISFTNAKVEDHGYGVTVNGKDLDEIISTALGTRLGNKEGYGSGLPNFESNCCDVFVSIQPHPCEVHIEDDNAIYTSVQDMEEDKENEYNKKNEKTDPEE